MTSWMKERDRLLEQTIAFVQGVAAKRPMATNAGAPAHQPAGEYPAQLPVSVTATMPPVVSKIAVDVSSAETDALISLMALSQPVRSPEPAMLPAEPIAIAPAQMPIRAATPQPVHRPAMRRPVDIALPERELIAKRVARFRTVQRKALQDRETSYVISQAQIRATLDPDPTG